jgi:hypothetical protein
MTASTTATAYSSDVTVVNAALPFLANIAKSFDKFSFDKLEIVYIPGVPTTVGATFAMSFDPNMYDATETTIAGFMQTHGAISTPIWQTATLRVPKWKLRSSEWFVGYQGTENKVETSFRAIGTFRAFVTSLLGVTSTDAISYGHLQVNYVVRLAAPSQVHDKTPKTHPHHLSFVSYNVNTVQLYRRACQEFGSVPFAAFYQAMRTPKPWVNPWRGDVEVSHGMVLDLDIEELDTAFTTLLL